MKKDFITSNGILPRFKFENLKVLRAYLNRTISDVEIELALLKFIRDLIPENPEKLGDL